MAWTTCIYVSYISVLTTLRKVLCNPKQWWTSMAMSSGRLLPNWDLPARSTSHIFHLMIRSAKWSLGHGRTMVFRYRCIIIMLNLHCGRRRICCKCGMFRPLPLHSLWHSNHAAVQTSFPIFHLVCLMASPSLLRFCVRIGIEWWGYPPRPRFFAHRFQICVNLLWI